MTFGAHLNHICIGSPDPKNLADFYCRAMKNKKRQEKDSWIVEGPERRLVFTKGELKELKYFALGMSESNLNKLRLRLESKNIKLEESPSPLFDDKAFSLRDPDGNHIVFGVAQKPHEPSILRARLQHIALATTDINALKSFYTEVIGYSVSDNVLNSEKDLKTTFLRSDNEHHSLAIFAASACWFDHQCYEAEEWNLIRDWADYLSTEDIKLEWGPGRHGPGNNLFFMIHDPDDNWVEISAELIAVEEDAPVGEWVHEPKTLNYWGQAFLRK